LFPEYVSPLSHRETSSKYFRLIQEITPFKHHLLFSYTKDGRLDSIEMRDDTQEETLGWILFYYESNPYEYLVKIATSSAETLEYHFTPTLQASGLLSYELVLVQGSDKNIPLYDYLNSSYYSKNTSSPTFLNCSNCTPPKHGPPGVTGPTGPT